jgi:hypothetical protein
MASEDSHVAPSHTVASMPMLANTAGEYEQEARSRQFNAIEAFGVYTFILVVIWPIWYFFARYLGYMWVESAVWFPFTLGAIFLLFISPRLHRDTLTSWGLSHPKHLIAMFQEGDTTKRLTLGAVIGALFVALNYANFSQWQHVSKFLQISKVEIGGTMIREFNTFFPGVLLVFAVGVVLSSLILTFAIRYDNFLPAFGMALRVGVPLAALIFLGAMVHGATAGYNPFQNFEPSQYALDVLGYVFWGFTQQLLFTAYLGNRFRKAFGPPDLQAPVPDFGDALKRGLIIGAGMALVITVLANVGVYALYGAGEVSLGLSFWLFVFCFPITAVYGFTLVKAKKRLLVATLAASCFALIHIDSYGLVGATFLLGIILIFVSMEDRYRNLMALGFIHGLLGSTFGFFFDNENSGALTVDYKVGPAGVEDPTLWVLVFPALCIVAFVAGIIWSTRNLPDKPTTRAMAH